MVKSAQAAPAYIEQDVLRVMVSLILREVLTKVIEFCASVEPQ